MNAAEPDVAVLLGGGIESTHLVSRFLDEGAAVTPLHVHCGLIWDSCEADHVRRFCARVSCAGLRPLVEISLPLAGFLGAHWAVTGKDVPRAGAAAADLEIPLRNLTLLGLAVHKLAGHGPLALVLGTTADNCYRDGSREYFDLCEDVLSIEAGRPVRVLTPLIGMTKIEVIRASSRQTLTGSFSCVDPRGGRHCGDCIKCGRRRQAFMEAGVDDPTDYAATA